MRDASWLEVMAVVWKRERTRLGVSGHWRVYYEDTSYRYKNKCE